MTVLKKHGRAAQRRAGQGREGRAGQGRAGRQAKSQSLIFEHLHHVFTLTITIFATLAVCMQRISNYTSCMVISQEVQRGPATKKPQNAGRRGRSLRHRWIGEEHLLKQVFWWAVVLCGFFALVEVLRNLFRTSRTSKATPLHLGAFSFSQNSQASWSLGTVGAYIIIRTSFGV